MNPLENPFSRRVWKRWAYGGFKLPRQRPAADKPQIEEDVDNVPPIVYLGVLIVLLICICLAVAGFWYLITHY
jgi:hypothetical protein